MQSSLKPSSSLIKDGSSSISRHSLESFNEIPKEQLRQYQYTKDRIRYEAGFSHNQVSLNMQKTFQRFSNNQPLQVLNESKQNMKSMMLDNVGKVIKKVMKSDYLKLLQRFQQSEDLFQDPDFKPSAESMGKTFVRKNADWKRISKIMPQCEFVSETISPEDILQGELGNCYFLSAIAALAESDFRIKNIFPSLHKNKNGIYMARILHAGVYQEVVVDDYIPVDRENKPLFAKPSGGREIWVMILEKCWAKLFGSYEAIIGGLPNQVLHAFSAAPTQYYQIKPDQSSQDTLFDRVLEASAKGAIMCCGTKSDPLIQRMGLVVGHAYTLIDVFVQPYRMLKVRNPWGEREWNGRASEKDKEFWSVMSSMDIERLGHVNQDDGTFFMLWEDFVNFFNMVDICLINDNANYLYQQEIFISDEPQIFEADLNSGDAVFTFSQPNLRQLDWKQRRKGYGTVTLVIGKQVAQSNGKTTYQYIDSSSETTFPEASITLTNLQSGKYFVMVSVAWTREPTDLGTVSAYTESSVILDNSSVKWEEFLYKTYLSHARHNQQCLQVFYQNPYEWACSDLLSDKCGLGYLAFHLDKNSTRKIGLQINQKDYEQNHLQLLPPYKGRGRFDVTAQPGKELIIMFKMNPGNYAASFTLPAPNMSIIY